jgi:hypothetical protein
MLRTSPVGHIERHPARTGKSHSSAWMLVIERYSNARMTAQHWTEIAMSLIDNRVDQLFPVFDAIHPAVTEPAEPLIPGSDVLATDAPKHKPDRRDRHRHEQRGGERYVDRNAFLAQAFHQIAEQSDHVITDGGD